MKFTAKDFEELSQEYYMQEAAARIANLKLAAHIEKAPVVLAADVEDKYWCRKPYEGDKYRGRVMFIEKIVKEPCKHEPIQRIFENSEIKTPVYELECKHCGVELIAEWKEKNE